MSLFLLALTAASAQPCPDISAQVDQAWRQYNDAELEAAKTVVVGALGSLDCQERVVSTETLLALYRLDGLVSLTNEDVKGATYATLRAVAAQHEGARPPERYGPELAELYDTWSARLSQALITLRVDGGGAVWVDGRPLVAAEPLAVAPGEHLVQIDDGTTVISSIHDLSEDWTVSTGVPVVGPPVPDPQPQPVPVPTPLPDLDPVPTVRSRARRRPAWIWGPAVAAAGGSAFALTSGWRSELAFDSDPYLPVFVGCDYDEPCYPQQREALVRYNARVINTAYGVGYGLAALSAGLTTITIVGLPARKK